MRARLDKNAFLLLATVAVSAASVVPAFAQNDSKAPERAPVLAAGKKGTTEATIAAYAWYWRDQYQQKIPNPTDGSDVATLELKNPFCPDTSPVGSPPDQICQSGRLPIEVRNGDYERPHKLSALNFDLSVVPPGSEIKKFTVKLYEGTDPQSQQLNVEGKRVQACEIDGIFGDGEARLYKERPDYECTKEDASALRDSETVGKGDNERQLFFWELDLTEQATEWMKKQEFFTSIMLHPKEPRDPTPQDTSWQLVFAGPKEEKFGIDTEIVYVSSGLPTTTPPPTTQPPGTLDPADPLPPTDTTDTGFDSGTGFDTGTTTVGTTDPTQDPPSSDAPTDGGTDTAAPSEAGGDQALASDEKEVPAGLPLYVWLAILAGMVGFSLVRSTVLEKNAGARPDGVLAQIQKLNAQRRGGEVALGNNAVSPLAAVIGGLAAVGNKIGNGAGKLAQLVSRKKG